MAHRAHRIFIKWAVTLLTLVGITLGARAATAGAMIQTFGGQTQYQDGWPDQYLLCLTVGTNQIVYSDYCNGGSNQLFLWPYGQTSDNQITWTSGSTTSCMTNHGSYVSMDPCQSGNEDQAWSVDGSNIQNAVGSECLDVYWGSTGSGTPLDVTTCNGTQAQWFWTPQLVHIVDVSWLCLAENPSGGGYSIQSCCFFSGEDCDDGQIYAQLFDMTASGEIQNAISNNCVQVNSSGDLYQGSCGWGWSNGQQWPDDGWSHDYEFFENTGNAFCLDVLGGQTATPGQTVDGYTCGGNGYNGGEGNLAQFWFTTTSDN